MARKFRCPRPVNRLVMMRAKNASGPFFQNAGNACVKGTGNFYAPGRPGSGPRAIRGEVVSPTTIHIIFTQCVTAKNPACVAPYGMTLTLLPSTPLTITGAAMQTEPNDNVMLISVSETIEAGDEIVWAYDDTGACWEDCDEGESVGDQGPIPVWNPLDRAGYFILLETGGADIILLEDDTDDTLGVQTEEAA